MQSRCRLVFVTRDPTSKTISCAGLLISWSTQNNILLHTIRVFLQSFRSKNGYLRGVLLFSYDKIQDSWFLLIQTGNFLDNSYSHYCIDVYFQRHRLEDTLNNASNFMKAMPVIHQGNASDFIKGRKSFMRCQNRATRPLHGSLQ